MVNKSSSSQLSIKTLKKDWKSYYYTKMVATSGIVNPNDANAGFYISKSSFHIDNPIDWGIVES